MTKQAVVISDDDALDDSMDMPIIRIMRHRQYAKAIMDIISCFDGLNEQSQEKIRTVFDQVSTPHSKTFTGVYNSIDHITPAHAKFVTRAYLAIYKQNHGYAARVPAFPTPPPSNTIVQRMREAKQRHYMATYTVRDSIMIARWEHYCKAHQWAWINVHEARKGTARLEIHLPEQTSFTANMNQSIVRIGQEAGLKSDANRIKTGDKVYIHKERYIKTISTIPTDATLYFVESVAQILNAAGHFPAVDESWHA